MNARRCFLGRDWYAGHTLPLAPAEWTASDSIRFETYFGPLSVYVEKGAAMSRTALFETGTLEFDMAAGPRSSNMGIAFRAQAADAFEVVFFRAGMRGRMEALRYGPAINCIGATWQLVHPPLCGAASRPACGSCERRPRGGRRPGRTLNRMQGPLARSQLESRATTEQPSPSAR
jgi:hypothetical protein